MEKLPKRYIKYREPEQNIEIQKTFTGRFKRKLPSKIELKNYYLSGHSFKTYTLKD